MDLISSAELAAKFGIPVRTFGELLLNEQRQWRDDRRRRNALAVLKRASALASTGAMTRVLRRYYDDDNLATGGLVGYSSIVDGVRIDSSVATTPLWTGLAIPLGGPNESCTLVNGRARITTPFPREIAALHASLEYRDLKLWNDPVYLLDHVTIRGRTQLTAAFSTDDFITYRFTIGLLLEELTTLLGAAKFSIDAVSPEAKALRLRRHFLPDGATLVDFSNRICAGGTLAVLAMAVDDGSFLVPIQRRSSQVHDAQGMLSVIPKAIHQPMIADSLETMISSTFYREFYEELLGGVEVERDVKHISPDWFFDKCEPLHWLRGHPESFTLECVCFGINLVAGNYEFGVLMAIQNPYFWEHFRSQLLSNWEVARLDRLVSSKDRPGISKLLQAPDWASEAWFTFIEGMQRLRELYPDKVDLPPLEVAYGTLK